MLKSKIGKKKLNRLIDDKKLSCNVDCCSTSENSIVFEILQRF